MQTEAEALVRLLIARGIRFACAESCTGGLIAKLITDVPGASAVFAGSAVTYMTETKNRMLGVPLEVLEKYGAVSSHTAFEMVTHSRSVCGAALGIAVTGYAGDANENGVAPSERAFDAPEADIDPGNQPGLVFIAVSLGEKTVILRCTFPGDRSAVRSAAAMRAITLAKEITE